MGSISIDDTFDYNGETYGTRRNKLGGVEIWVYVPGNDGSHRAWQQVHNFKTSTDEDSLNRARQWVEEHL